MKALEVLRLVSIVGRTWVWAVEGCWNSPEDSNLNAVHWMGHLNQHPGRAEEEWGTESEQDTETWDTFSESLQRGRLSLGRALSRLSRFLVSLRGAFWSWFIVVLDGLEAAILLDTFVAVQPWVRLLQFLFGWISTVARIHVVGLRERS